MRPEWLAMYRGASADLRKPTERFTKSARTSLHCRKFPFTQAARWIRRVLSRGLVGTGPAATALHHAIRFSERDKVDAVIRLGSSLVPVDSKFPLENFKRIIDTTVDGDQARAKRQFAADVRKHIDAIATKYILPDEGTYDFALMYIPAENAYYEIIIKDDSTEEKSLSHYAMSKRVVPVSPNCFYAYLQAIVLGLKGMTIEQRAKEIIECLSRLQGDFTRFRDEFGLLGKHLGHAQSSYQNAEKRVEQFGQKLVSAYAGEADVSNHRARPQTCLAVGSSEAASRHAVKFVLPVGAWLPRHLPSGDGGEYVRRFPASSF